MRCAARGWEKTGMTRGRKGGSVISPAFPQGHVAEGWGCRSRISDLSCERTSIPLVFLCHLDSEDRWIELSVVAVGPPMSYLPSVDSVDFLLVGSRGMY